MNSTSEVITTFLQGLDQKSAESAWREFITLHREHRFSLGECRQVWQRVFRDWDLGLGPVPCWVPDETRIATANVSRWMEELAISDVRQFHLWTTENRSEFWEMAIDELEIAFRTEPESILPTETSLETPHWLPDERLNIVESCFLASEDQLAVISGDFDGNLTYRSYGELRRRANQVANALIQQGFQPGHSIGVIMPVSFESISIYLGIIQAGLVAVSIADSFAAKEIENRLKIANAKAVFAYDSMQRSGKTIALGDRVRGATDLPVYLVGTELDDKENAVDWLKLITQQSVEFDPVICNPLDPINVLFSSGTTGDPKAIPWNHTVPIKCAVDALLHHNLMPGDVVAWPTNLGWMMGPWLIFATLINKGTIAVYEDVPFGAGFGEFVQNAQVNMLGVVPSMVRVWKQTESIQQFDWSAVKAFSSTGEASNADDMFYLSWLAGFQPIIEYCGGTEIGGGYLSSTVVQNNAPATFSTPAFGLDLEILGELELEGGSPPTGVVEAGELFLVPPSIGLSIELLNRDHEQTYYSGCPVRGGYRLRRHGDFFRRLDGGYFAAGGRADDTMNLGGIKVSSIEIETVLNQLKGISETAAVAIPFEDSGPDQLVIFYVSELETGGEFVSSEETVLKEMNDAIRAELNPLFKIRKIFQKAALPRTASNKIVRRSLREELR